MTTRILLVGGTSESVAAAHALVADGHEVLISQATEAALAYPPGARLRRGRLDLAGFRELLRAEGAAVVVDAAHPFAQELHATVREAARLEGVRALRLERSGDPLPAWVHPVEDAAEAARVAFALGRTVLATTGSRTLGTYVRAAREAGGELWARMLPCEESLRVLAACGHPEERVAWGRGPFSVEDTEALLRRCGATVLVAKDSGDAGGMAERLEAARRTGTAVVAIRRPPREEGGVGSVEELRERL